MLSSFIHVTCKSDPKRRKFLPSVKTKNGTEHNIVEQRPISNFFWSKDIIIFVRYESIEFKIQITKIIESTL